MLVGRKTAGVVAALVVLLLATVPAVQAAVPIDPAISVYVEQLPSGSGGVAVNAAETSGPPISKRLAGRIRRDGGSSASALETLARSEVAPRSGRPVKHTAPRSGHAPTAPSERASGGSAVADQLPLLFALLVATAALLLVAHRRTGPAQSVTSRR